MLHFSHAISGFARALSGEELGYRNFHPQATQALLTRCLDGQRHIRWESAPVPEGAPVDEEGRVTFVWLAAHSSGTSAADATFTLEVDDQPALSFTTKQAERQRQWTVAGRDGIRLSFDAQWEDAVADLYGYMRLAVPLELLRPGRPLRLGLCGEAAHRRDWAMTFLFPMRDTVELQAQPALVRSPQGPRQVVQALVNILESRSLATLHVPGQEPQQAELHLGFNRVAFQLPQVETPTPFFITLCRPGHADHVEELLLRPVRQRELWILPHSHVDVGYSDLQVDVERKQLHNLRMALAEHARTADYPVEARAAWNAEIAWPVQRFLAQATEEERQALFSALREGGIGLNAFYTNPLTGICRPEELLRLTEDARLVAQEAGVEVCDAMITDIPGSSWATVTALAQAGIRYYSSGPNYNPGLTGGGDRVGHFNQAWGDKPCWWYSASGQERLLFWVAGRGYSAFHGSALRREDGGSATRLYDYLRELEADEHPYDMVQLRYTIGGDNGPVDTELPDFVRHWNEEHLSPRLRLSTSAAMFKAFESRWGHVLPEVRGEISPYWEDGALSTLRELSLARRASERLVQAECLATLLPGPFPQEARDDAWRLVHLSDEHTWGAWNSVSEPDCDFVQEQWRVKRGYMEGADAASRQLLDTLLAQDAAGGVVEVVNTQSWMRTDLVEVETLPGNWSVRDETGAQLPVQRLHNGKLAFLAQAVPPLGSRRYTLEEAQALPVGPVLAHGNTLTNGLVTVKIDAATGAISSLRDAQGRDFATAGAPLNHFARVEGTDAFVLEEATVERMEVLEEGPVLGLLRVHLRARSCRALFTDYRVVAGLERLDVVNHLEREDCRDKEAVHFRFPVDLPNARLTLDGGWAPFRPREDSLPGSCRDFLCAGRWLDLSCATHGLVCTTVDTPLVEPGALVDERPDAKGRRQWRRDFAPGPGFHTYAMNNYWHTNYAASQPGMASLEHRLHPHGPFQPLEAFQRGMEAGQPLLVRRVRAQTPAATPPLRLDNGHVLVSALHPSRDGKAVMLRLFNASAENQELRVDGLGGEGTRLSSVKEEAGPVAPDTLGLAPWQLITLRLGQ